MSSTRDARELTGRLQTDGINVQNVSESRDAPTPSANRGLQGNDLPGQQEAGKSHRGGRRGRPPKSQEYVNDLRDGDVRTTRGGAEVAAPDGGRGHGGRRLGGGRGQGRRGDGGARLQHGVVLRNGVADVLNEHQENYVLGDPSWAPGGVHGTSRGSFPEGQAPLSHERASYERPQAPARGGGRGGSRGAGRGAGRGPRGPRDESPGERGRDAGGAASSNAPGSSRRGAERMDGVGVGGPRGPRPRPEAGERGPRDDEVLDYKASSLTAGSKEAVTCVVCCEEAKVVALGGCGHDQICAHCCLRLRLCLSDMRCPLCKAVNAEVLLGRPTPLLRTAFAQLQQASPAQPEPAGQTEASTVVRDRGRGKGAAPAKGTTVPVVVVPDIVTANDSDSGLPAARHEAAMWSKAAWAPGVHILDQWVWRPWRVAKAAAGGVEEAALVALAAVSLECAGNEPGAARVNGAALDTEREVPEEEQQGATAVAAAAAAGDDSAASAGAPDLLPATASETSAAADDLFVGTLALKGVSGVEARLIREAYEGGLGELSSLRLLMDASIPLHEKLVTMTSTACVLCVEKFRRDLEARVSGKGGSARPPLPPRPFLNEQALQVHLRTAHEGRQLCDICLRSGMKFPMELRPMDAAEMASHVRDNHHKCKFCSVVLYSKDDLHVHMRDRHFSCHVCARMGVSDAAELFFPSPEHLMRHMQERHHVCPEPACTESFVAFPSEQELRDHCLQMHPRGLGRWDATRARPVLLDFGSMIEQRARRTNERPGRGGGGDASSSSLSSRPAPSVTYHYSSASVTAEGPTEGHGRAPFRLRRPMDVERPYPQAPESAAVSRPPPERRRQQSGVADSRSSRAAGSNDTELWPGLEEAMAASLVASPPAGQTAAGQPAAATGSSGGGDFRLYNLQGGDGDDSNIHASGVRGPGGAWPDAIISAEGGMMMIDDDLGSFLAPGPSSSSLSTSPATNYAASTAGAGAGAGKLAGSPPPSFPSLAAGVPKPALGEASSSRGGSLAATLAFQAGSTSQSKSQSQSKPLFGKPLAWGQKAPSLVNEREFPSLASSSASVVRRPDPARPAWVTSAPAEGAGSAAAASSFGGIEKRTVSCPCGRRRESFACRQGRDSDLPVFECNADCESRRRRLQLAEAFGVPDPDRYVSVFDRPRSEGLPDHYPPDLVKTARTCLGWLPAVERQMAEFAAVSGDVKQLLLPPMTKPMRALVHELATFYGLATVSINQGNQRAVRIIRGPKSGVPQMTLFETASIAPAASSLPGQPNGQDEAAAPPAIFTPFALRLVDVVPGANLYHYLKRWAGEYDLVDDPSYRPSAVTEDHRGPRPLSKILAFTKEMIYRDCANTLAGGVRGVFRVEPMQPQRKKPSSAPPAATAASSSAAGAPSSSSSIAAAAAAVVPAEDCDGIKTSPESQPPQPESPVSRADTEERWVK